MTSTATTPFLQRSWYHAEIGEFQHASDDIVLGQLVRGSAFPVLQTQKEAWSAELALLRAALSGHSGRIYIEFEIPRIGHRVDAIVLVNGLVLIIEFKVGARSHASNDIDQVYDYAMDLKYFHEGSHNLPVVPILVATQAPPRSSEFTQHKRIEGLYKPICACAENLLEIIGKVVHVVPGRNIDIYSWESARYCPTPTIIEAARALYSGHGVAEISRSDAAAINLSDTSNQLAAIIEETRDSGRKAICFVTGVPGAGKTLVGLNMATKYNDPSSELHSVFLSGNGPLVAILREALARDAIRRERVKGMRLKKGEATSQVKAFIQNVHQFRDECIRDSNRPPVDHVVIFDEAQRAWDRAQTSAFMRRKKGNPNFHFSEPEFLISCMDRRRDWAVIICLVGGGQEINTGEAGIGEWIEALRRSFNDWHLYISPSLADSEYGAGSILAAVKDRKNVSFCEDLHLGVSVRSFRSEKVSAFVKTVLDCEVHKAKTILREIVERYPIVLCRNIEIAKEWLRDQSSGTERYGIVVSSQAERLKPYALDVRTPVNPVKWFLNEKDDVRSSYYLEDVATEFHVQGLELDWVCVCWDGDFRYNENGWKHFSFRGTRWQRINQSSRRNYLKNAYRVLLTRARQGMVIFIPEGSTADPTRHPDYYDATFAYLHSVGLPVL